jgi:hypothetical protein
MTIDITEARALVETLKDYAEHPSSFTDISPTEADAAADLIDALLNEVERLNSPVVLSEWQKLVTERDALAREVDACAAALPGPYYMDPPDGGDVPISEQVKRTTEVAQPRVLVDLVADEAHQSIALCYKLLPLRQNDGAVQPLHLVQQGGDEVGGCIRFGRADVGERRRVLCVVFQRLDQGAGFFVRHARSE